eukprot:scaffold307_cov390-Prasinococcus_capsulatus_cf.AAC.23
MKPPRAERARGSATPERQHQPRDDRLPGGLVPPTSEASDRSIRIHARARPPLRLSPAVPLVAFAPVGRSSSCIYVRLRRLASMAYRYMYGRGSHLQA